MKRRRAASTGVAGDKYLNLWVCTLGGGLLGYAQFPGGPASDGRRGDPEHRVRHDRARLQRRSTSAARRLTRSATGSTSATSGATACDCGGTRLRHGHAERAGPNFGKPTFPHISCNNGPNGDMFMNYMDYVDDDAMFMFTAGQGCG